MKRFELSADAARDIEEIWRYIAADNVTAAGHFRRRLLSACRQLGDSPGLGHARKDLTDEPVLFWPVGAWLVIYERDTQPLRIVRVVHGARDIAGLV